MNRIRLWIIAALAAAMTLSIIGVASAQPLPPPVFTGTVTSDDGTAVAAGLPVEAWVDGTNCALPGSGTSVENGQTRYFVAFDDQQEVCNTRGNEVRFRVGNRWANERAEVIPLGLPTHNLTLGAEAVTINVAVWRLQSDPTRLFVSTQAPGEAWITHPGQLVMTEFIGRNRWDISDERPVVVTLADSSTVTINVAVWRLQSDPTRLFISTQAPGESWITHPRQLVMTEFIGRNRWDISDERPVEVELE